MTSRPRSSPPPKYWIASYWQKECGYNSDEGYGWSFVIDIGEPSCFACGWYKPTWVTYDAAGGCIDLVKIWAGTTGLQIAHLVPHSLGGGTAPENLVLLCKECHQEAPDYIDPNYMLDWMRRRGSYVQRQYLQLEEAFKLTGMAITKNNAAEVEAALRSEGFKRFFMDRTTTHAAAISLATFAAMLKDYTGLQKYFLEALVA